MKQRYVSGLQGFISLVLGIGILALAATPAAAVEAPVSRTLAQGAGMGTTPDPGVRSLQQVLRTEGRSLGPAGIDGRFGPATAAAVRSFQQSFGLPADGVVGPKTRKLLRVVCGADCGNGNHKISNRSAANRNRTGREQVTPSNDSGGLRNVAPTAVVVLAILLAALGYRRWRLNREARAYAAPASSFPAIRPARRLGRRVIGYIGAVDYGLTHEQEEAHEEAIERECRRRGWTLLDVLREVPGGGREALAYALDVIDGGDATCLVVAEVDSVAGSPSALARVLERLKNAGACFLAIDAKVDTTTREGAMAAALVVAVTTRARERAPANGANGANGHPYEAPKEARMN
jgi:peptidoglycan hydrolase-like protein with peptidoglycan-binding domain